MQTSDDKVDKDEIFEPTVRTICDAKGWMSWSQIIRCLEECERSVYALIHLLRRLAHCEASDEAVVNINFRGTSFNLENL